MNMTASRVFVSSVLISGMFAGLGRAQDMKYELTGIGSGSLNGSYFINQAFDIVATGPDANIDFGMNGGYQDYSMFPVTMTVTIDGIGELPVTDTSYFFASADGYAGFGADPYGDLVEFYGQPFIATYDPDNDVSPISVTGQAVGGRGDETTEGALAFYYAGDTVFSAEAVPEPGSWTMMLLGFAGVGAMARTLRTGRRASWTKRLSVL